MSKKDTKVFRDPIYNLISFDKNDEEPIINIISTPEFQRLRRIRQLGFSNYTFPTAVHDRFSHSLGVAFIIGELADNLGIGDQIEIPTIVEKGEIQNIKIDKNELRLLLKLTGLLHDIGHGPFSHAFEKITGVNHEEMTKKIIETQSISNILSKIRYSETLSKYSKQWIIDILNGTFNPIWIKELISSQLDSDRIDYLLRDAYMCGVTYASFDIKWLFKNIEVDTIKSENDREGLVINAKKGIHAVESFIISRYHMYEQVYFHKTTRCFELIVQKIFERLLYLRKDNKFSDSYFLNSSFLDILEDKDNLNAFLELDDFTVFAHIKHWMNISRDKILKKLCNYLLNRKPYKMIKEVELDYKDISELEKDMREKIPKDKFDYYFFVDDYKNVPYKDPYLIGEKVPEKAEHIWLKFENQQKELAEISPIIKSLKNKELKKYRAYVHRDYI
ncbi:MAG: HD domain-containing protein [Promethearchaeota archaeon]